MGNKRMKYVMLLYRYILLFLTIKLTQRTYSPINTRELGFKLLFRVGFFLKADPLLLLLGGHFELII